MNKDEQQIAIQRILNDNKTKWFPGFETDSDSKAHSALLDIPLQDYSTCYDENGIEIASA